MERPWLRHYDYNVPTTLRYPQITVSELLNIPATSLANKPALTFHGVEMSFYELRREVLRLAGVLGELGIQKGDRVGLQLPTSPQYVLSYYAILSLGGIVTNLNPMYTVPELRYTVEHTGMTTLFTTAENLEKAVQLVDETAIERVVVSRTSDFYSRPQARLDLPDAFYDLAALRDAATTSRRPRVTVSPDEAAPIQFTGGTTGVPKGAVLSHQNLVTATLMCSQWGNAINTLRSVASRNVLSVLPYYHVYGNLLCMNMSLLTGATQILVDRFDIDGLVDILASHEEIAFFPAVPTLISALVHHPRAEEIDLGRRIGLLNSGGAPMPVELIERVRDMNVYYGEGWGMSESTSLGIANPVFGLSKVGSIGIPFPDVDVKLVDIESGTEEVAQGEPGEIVLKGPIVMQGYWDDPQKTAEQIQHGWLYTGDIAIRDEDDYFFIVDRKKDMIIAGGYNVYPREIDEVLYQHPQIVEAVAVGIPDDYRGETVKAFVVLAEGAEASAEEIIDHCRGSLAAYKVPKQVEFRAALPKSTVGKILRKTLRQEEQERRDSDAE